MLAQLEYENGIPRNPFINAGALVVTDRLHVLATRPAPCSAFLRAESGNADLTFDKEVAASEATRGYCNWLFGHFMASYGNIDNPVPVLLDQYFRQCSIEASCADLALATSFLARHGIRADGSRLLTQSQAKQVNAVMLTCGTYDVVGEFAYRVGLPGKSGVGGGHGGGPRPLHPVRVEPRSGRAGQLGAAGVAALDRFTTLTGVSVF